MGKKRQLKCNCGGTFEEKELEIDNLFVIAEKCSKCGEIIFSQKQAEEFLRLKELQDIVTGKRNIIKIGNSMGITLPEKLREFGVKVGSKVKIKATGSRSFELSF